MNMNNAIYNAIGKTYDLTRKADPIITQTILDLLKPQATGKYLDLACGSGNYTVALHEQNLDIDGIDISEEMLSKAKSKSELITWYHGNAESLPFKDKSYNGIICTLATHHISNIKAVFSEVYRILTPNSKFVILTATPEQMRNYWLCEYFPIMIEDGQSKMKSFEELELILNDSGFSNIEKLPFFVTNELQDLFLQSGKYRPAIYLDKHVRSGISSFHVSTNEDEIRSGLQKLKNDIDSGGINQVIKDHESNLGDYMFISGQKL